MQTTEYHQNMTAIRADIAHLTDLVNRGVYPQSLLDAYLGDAQKRTDWS